MKRCARNYILGLAIGLFALYLVGDRLVVDKGNESFPFAFGGGCFFGLLFGLHMWWQYRRGQNFSTDFFYGFGGMTPTLIALVAQDPIPMSGVPLGFAVTLVVIYQALVRRWKKKGKPVLKNTLF